jgi:hypothetical protein
VIGGEDEVGSVLKIGESQKWKREKVVKRKTTK